MKEQFTHLATVWILNDQKARESARRYLERSADIEALAAHLRSYVSIGRPEMQDGIYSDLLSHALTRVDWLEVAEDVEISISAV